jgi:hypothetical protein
VADAVCTVASISEETAAGALELSDSAEQTSHHTKQMTDTIVQQTHDISKVNTAVTGLNDMAQQTRRLVARFQNFQWDRRAGESDATRDSFQDRRTMTIQAAAERSWLKEEAGTKKVAADKKLAA